MLKSLQLKRSKPVTVASGRCGTDVGDVRKKGRHRHDLVQLRDRRGPEETGGNSKEA